MSKTKKTNKSKVPVTPEAGKAISVAEQQHKARAAAKAPSGSVRLSPTAAAAAGAAMDQHVATAALEKRSAALALRLRGAVDAKRAERTAVRPPTSGAPTATPASAPSTLAAGVDDDDEASSEEGEVDDDDGAAPAVTLAAQAPAHGDNVASTSFTCDATARDCADKALAHSVELSDEHEHTRAMLSTLRDDVKSLQQVVISQTASIQGLMITVERGQDMLVQLVSSNSAPAVLFDAVADDARPVSRLPPPPARVQPAVDPRIERHAGLASATQHAALPADTLRAAGLSAERSLFTATPPAPLPFVRGISPKML